MVRREFKPDDPRGPVTLSGTNATNGMYMMFSGFYGPNDRTA